MLLQSSFAQQEGDIDFDREVRKITGSVEEALKVANDDDEQQDQIIDTVQQRQKQFVLLMHIKLSFPLYWVVFELLLHAGEFLFE